MKEWHTYFMALIVFLILAFGMFKEIKLVEKENRLSSIDSSLKIIAEYFKDGNPADTMRAE